MNNLDSSPFLTKHYSELRIVFMGTPEFAVASLHALLISGCQIVGVITAPDKPAGRGMKLTDSAVKKYAVEKNLLILQPEKLKNEEWVTVKIGKRLRRWQTARRIKMVDSKEAAHRSKNQM